jgi:hypothetical protein
MKWIQYIVFIIKDLILDAHEKIRTKTPTPTITSTPTITVPPVEHVIQRYTRSNMEGVSSRTTSTPMV